jgi:hypothetical protein
MENRNGLEVASEVSQASGRAVREAASRMARSLRMRTRKHSVPIRGTTPESSLLAYASAASRPNVAQNTSRSI